MEIPRISCATTSRLQRTERSNRAGARGNSRGVVPRTRCGTSPRTRQMLASYLPHETLAQCSRSKSLPIDLTRAGLHADTFQ